MVARACGVAVGYAIVIDALIVTPLSQDVYAQLILFLQQVVGSAVPIVQGLGNRVSMPPDSATGFIAMTEINRRRLRTNVHTDGFGEVDPTTIVTTEGVELTVQIDVYGPTSDDQAQMISTLFRDEFGCDLLSPVCQPLNADEPRMIPLIDSEQQYEMRWTLNALLQYNPATTSAQQFANTLEVELINVDEAYPP
jgi:hypothetical protein